MAEPKRRVSRRAVLSAAAGGVAAAAAGGPAMAESAAVAGGPAAAGADASAGVAAALQPVSMAMHIHGPFSEGSASFESHLAQARKHGVNVVWWTDHDFRVAAHDHRRVVHFDAASEPEGELSWTWARKQDGTLASSTVEFVDAPHSPDDPGRALRLAATGGAGAGGLLWYTGTAWNYTYSTCIADTTLQLDLLPEQAGPGAVFLLRMELSHHPARAGRPAGIHFLRYRFGGVTQAGYGTDGLTGTVDLPVTPGGWNRFTLALADDVRRLWPDLVAEDNSLRNLRIGVSVAAATPASYVVDRLVFDRARRSGQAGEDLRAEVLDRYRDEYPDVTHFRSYEVSLVRHLNWYGGDQTLPAFPSPPYRDNDASLTASMVDFLHGHGGIVCWNHPMDVEKRDTLARLMIERRTLGADLVEIGRDPLVDLLWVYDVAARNALFFTAVGASDDHDGDDWLAEPERWLTCVWAESTDRAELVRALRKGSAWFTDPARYRGSVDLRIAGRTAMGEVAVTGASSVGVELIATGLPSGSVLELITGVADLAGTAKLAPSVTTKRVAATYVKSGRYAVTVRPGTTGVYVRTQVRTADNAVAAVSNPLWLLRRKPPSGIPAERRRYL